MSVSVRWKPVSKISNTLNGKSVLMEALNKAGYSLPRQFDYRDISVLKGMAAVWQHGSGTIEGSNPYEQITEAIEKHEVIEIYAEY